MNFSLQRILTVVAAIGLFFAAISRGEYLLGSLGVFLFGFLAILAISLTFNLLLKWEKHSIPSKFVVFIFAGAMIYPMIFPENMWPDYHFFAKTRQRQRVADQLQTTLANESDYRDVRVRYSAPLNSKNKFLDIHGDVPNLNKYEQLVNRVESLDNWFVEWRVTINGNEPPQPVD